MIGDKFFIAFGKQEHLISFTLDIGFCDFGREFMIGWKFIFWWFRTGVRLVPRQKESVTWKHVLIIDKDEIDVSKWPV